MKKRYYWILAIALVLSLSVIAIAAELAACSGSEVSRGDPYDCAIYYHDGCKVTPIYYGSTDGDEHVHYYAHSYGVTYCVCPYDSSIASLD